MHNHCKETTTHKPHEILVRVPAKTRKNTWGYLTSSDKTVVEAQNCNGQAVS